MLLLIVFDRQKPKVTLTFSGQERAGDGLYPKTHLAWIFAARLRANTLASCTLGLSLQGQLPANPVSVNLQRSKIWLSCMALDV